MRGRHSSGAPALMLTLGLREGDVCAETLFSGECECKFSCVCVLPRYIFHVYMHFMYVSYFLNICFSYILKSFCILPQTSAAVYAT